MTYLIRTAKDSEWDEIYQIIADAFNDSGDEGNSAEEHGVWEAERSFVAELDGAIAGHAAAFTRNLAVPGASVPASHVTMVSVGATHRRQGLLTRMITEIHAQAIDRGEPLAVLWASEGKIYQRYGYGLAAQRAFLDGRSADIVLRRPPADDGGRVIAAPITSTEVFGPIFDAAAADRPGWSSRDERWWAYRLSDIPDRRAGATTLRAVVHEDASGHRDGYLLWRVKADWTHNGPNGQVRIHELITTTPAAYQALWQFALSVDLTRNVSCDCGSVDEPILFLATEPRAITARLGDSLWVRILDLPAALTARRYAAPVDVVLEVADVRIPANQGRWHLVGSAGHATCEPTEAPADLAMDIHALGSAYLGGTALATLAAGGAVREIHAGTLAAASVALGWHRPPSSLEIF